MEQRVCPLCKRPIDEHNAGWQAKSQQVYPMGSGGRVELAPGMTWERQTPARSAGVGSDVAVPFLQSAITACAGGIAGGVLFGWPGVAIGGGVIFSATWLTLLRSHRAALWITERILGADLDGDDVIGEPSTVRVEVVESNGRQARMQWLDLPISDAQLAEVARVILVQEANFSRPGLADVLSQNEYHKLALAMVNAGLLVDLPGNRRELTAAGRALLRQTLGK